MVFACSMIYACSPCMWYYEVCVCTPQHTTCVGSLGMQSSDRDCVCILYLQYVIVSCVFTKWIRPDHAVCVCSRFIHLCMQPVIALCMHGVHGVSICSQ